MTYGEVVPLADAYLLPLVSELYGLEGCEISLITAHSGGRNVVYACEKEGMAAKIIRIVFLNDRNREQLLGEADYIRYVFEQGGSVSNVIGSKKGNLLEEIAYQDHSFYICLFEKAKGTTLPENHYRYREGAPLAEYYYNCGQVLGKLHQLSKGYTPVHRRHRFQDKYTIDYIDQLIPDSLSRLKEKLIARAWKTTSRMQAFSMTFTRAKNRFSMRCGRFERTNA